MKENIYKPEHELNAKISQFQKKLGIVDEGNIVENDDYVESHTLSYDE